MNAADKVHARVGIIGCSSIARRRFLPALIGSDKAALEIIGSREWAKAKQTAELFDCAAYGSYDDVINSHNVDLVYISTPPTERKYLLEAAIKAGKHVLCEKPLLSNAGETKEVLELAAHQGVRVFENYAYVCHPQHAAVKKLISQNLIGLVRDISVRYTYPLPAANDIRLKPELGGGVVNDSLGYPISLANYLEGSRFDLIESSIGHSNKLGVDVNCKFRAVVGKRINFTAYVGMDEEYRSAYVVTGDSGVIEVTRAFSVDESHQATVILRTAQGREVVTVMPANQFRMHLEDCVSALSRKDDFAEGNILAVRTLMDEVIRSASTAVIP